MTGSKASFPARLVDYVTRRPAAAFGWLLGFHLLIWTLAPILLSRNLQLDLAEDLALGREWQLGYWKHPPLPWWLADLVHRITGHVDAVYVLGPLAAALCFYAVWLLARELVGELKALIAVAALQGIHYYNLSVVKFAHDQLQLPFWAFTGLFFWRALVRGRNLDWGLAGVFLAGAFWSKYAAFALAATLGLVLLIDPFARRAWRTPGPYIMAAAFAIVLAPNVWWLVTHDFMPLHYVDSRAVTATRWYHVIVFPMHWIGGQTLQLAPALLLLCLLYLPFRPRGPERAPAAANNSFARSIIAALALGPFAVTTVAAIVLGRRPVVFWSYPMWSFLPLAMLLWLPPALDPVRLRRFATATAAVTIGFPIVFALIEVGDPLLHNRLRATQFPGRLMAEALTQRWRERTGTPLTYVGGAMIFDRSKAIPREIAGAGEFAANNVAVYSSDRPHVVVKGELALSPWIDAADLVRRGLVLTWQSHEPEIPENLKQAFPRLEPQPPLSMSRLGFFPWVSREPVVVYYAFVLPRR
jgi:4-amino-4-deoxy-L-arabinose transferase-like glycosyltransferase